MLLTFRVWAWAMDAWLVPANSMMILEVVGTVATAPRRPLR